MNKKILLNIILGTAVLGLSACDKDDGVITSGQDDDVTNPGQGDGVTKTVRIMQQDKSRVAITINKGFSTSVIAINDGERVEPCEIDPLAVKRDRNAALVKCYPEGREPGGKTLYAATWEVRVSVGSPVCADFTSGSVGFVLCEPQFNLDLFGIDHEDHVDH